MTDNERIMLHALINISKGGICWDGDRRCQDPGEVAGRALKKVDPELYKIVDDLPYIQVKVYKNGSVSFKGMKR